MTNLELARYLLAGLDQRRDARNEAGNLGEWQTELNEVVRALHYVVAHLGGDVQSAMSRQSRVTGDDLDDELGDY